MLIDKIVKFQFIIIILVFSVSVYADNYYSGSQYFEKCMSEAVKVKQGNIIKIELKRENNMLVYEYDIRDEDNRDWDVECQADTGEIIELEREVFGIYDKAFHSYMKINLEQAKTIALQKYPGEIIEIEYEIEEDGRAVYEFDIDTEDDKEMKIEIDAASGNIHEETEELWQIGYE
ncbi:MAG: peptidase [Proteobacteria bacterium]|nr:peptidase [Pseudomonadota bacterium]